MTKQSRISFLSRRAKQLDRQPNIADNTTFGIVAKSVLEKVSVTAVVFIPAVLSIDQDISLFCLCCQVLLYSIFDFYCYIYA